MIFVNKAFIFVIFAFVSSSAIGDGIEKDSSFTSTVSITTNSTPTIAPNSSSTSTANPTTPTTLKPSTASSTSKPSTASSTSKPSTASSTTSNPTTPLPPSSTSAPSEDIWVVKNSTDGSSCILMKSNIVLQLTYNYNSTTKQSNTTNILIPKKLNVSGSCGTLHSSQNLSLSWTGKENNKTNIINFIFNEENCDYYLNNITASVYADIYKNGSAQQFNLTFAGNAFLARKGKSFTCESPSPLKLEESDSTFGELQLNSLKYEAFAVKKDKTFSAGQDCITNETPDIVPIAVAVALISLVIIVLVAYVITRRRSQARGYLSM